MGHDMNKGDMIAGGIVIVSVVLFILDAMPKLTTLIYSMVIL